MKGFISFAREFSNLLLLITEDSYLHSKWLNTLSYLENCGARKIAACEHPTKVKEEMLKHAAEEFRHAYHLKHQIHKVFATELVGFHSYTILGGRTSFHYLNALDVQISRYLTHCGLKKTRIKEVAYILVTYVIELRARELYELYDHILKQNQSKVRIKSILLEEQEHLEEMEKELRMIPYSDEYCQWACQAEGRLCHQWIHALYHDARM